MDITKENAISLLCRASIGIDAISDTDREYAGNAGIRLAKLNWPLLGERANSNKFISAFGELKRFINQLDQKRNLTPIVQKPIPKLGDDTNDSSVG